MFDDEAVTFIAGKDYVVIAKGDVAHAEIITDVHGGRFGNKMMLRGNKESLISDIENANGVVGNVGILQGRVWSDTKFISFWETKLVAKNNKKSMAYIFKALGTTPKGFEFEFEYDESASIDPDRHVKSLGARYLTKDTPGMKTPEEDRFEKILRIKQQRKN